MARRGTYRARDWVVVRAPLLPVELLATVGSHARTDPAIADGAGPATAASGSSSEHAARIALAIAVGSGHLAEAVANGEEVAPDAQADVARKTSRYLIRMASRPTPYATFAGVAMGGIGNRTVLHVDPAREQRSARPDAAWLMALVCAMEARDAVRLQLEVRAHPLLRVHDGRVAPLDPLSAREGQAPPSIEASEFVIAALAAARQPLRCGQLVEELVTTTGAGRAQAEALVRELVAAELLLSELRPPLTAALAPAAHVAQRLAGLAEPPPEAEALRTILAELDRWTLLEPGQARRTWSDIDHRLEALCSGPRTRLQVDLALGVEQAVLGRELADAAADAAALLLRLSPRPSGSGAWRQYRDAFEARYGKDCCVRLLEVIDARSGLGQPPANEGPAADPARLNRRHATLLALAQQAVIAGRTTVELDDASLERLTLQAPDPESWPVSLDLAVCVLAESEAAIARGDWQLLVGNNTGARQGGRYLGRFATMLGAPAIAALDDLAAAEAAHAPWALWSESVYPPTRLRSANVAIRPHRRTHEIALGVPAGEHAQAIPVDELDLALVAGQLRLYWNGREVRVRAGHMLITRHAPALSRFIEELDLQEAPWFGGFDWGAAVTQIFLPRVTHARLVLAPAQWRIDAEALGGRATIEPERWAASFATFRATWKMPDEVYLVEGDNRLLLDLDDPRQAAQLRDALSSRGEGRDILVQEALPGRAHAWASGRDGHYFSEWIVPLVRPSRPSPAPSAPPPGAPLPPLAADRPVPGDLSRLRPPGTDWLFVKLYGPASQEGELLAGPVQAFCTMAVAAGHCASWFFIRYSDPDPHVRLRLRGDPNRLLGELVPELCRWAGGLLAAGRITRFALDTYERELERYGGPAGLAWCEAWFALDSQAVAGLIGLQHQHLESAPDRLALVAVSVDEMLAALGLEPAQRLAWYRRVVLDRHASGEAYRKLQKPLRAWFDPAQRGAHWPAWWHDWVATRAAGAAGARSRLAVLEARGTLEIGLDKLLSSLVHMHCNRLLGTDTAAERTALGLMLRVHEGLRGTRA